jgi:uncharacterized membrane protein YbhN (UPF0104 family)
MVGKSALRMVGLVAAAGVAAVVLRHKLPDGHEVVRAVGAADPRLLLAAAAAQAVSMEMFARQQRSLLRAFGVRLSAGRSRAITYARTAISATLPVGSVISAGFAFTQWRAKGATRNVAATVMVLSGLASFGGLVTLFLTGSGAAVLAHPGAVAAVPVPALAAVAVVAGAAVLVGLVLTRIRRFDGPRATAVRALRAAARLPRRYALAALAFAGFNWLTDLVCLVVTARAVHLRVDLLTVTGVYLAVQVVRQLPVTPGGVGVIETSLLAGLVSAGAGRADAGAAVLAYRVLSCWLIVPIGLATWAVLSGGRIRRRLLAGNLLRNRDAKQIRLPVVTITSIDDSDLSEIVATQDDLWMKTPATLGDERPKTRLLVSS